MKGNLKKGITMLSLAAVMTFAAAGLTACATEENDRMEEIGNGYIILNDQHPEVYRLHRFLDSDKSINGNGTLCGYTFHYTLTQSSQYNAQYMFVLDKVDELGNVTSRQFDTYMKVIAEGVEINPKCYGEICEECFPDLNK